MGPLVHVLSHHRRFHRRLILWFTVSALTVHGRRGTSPVRLTSHFPQVTTRTTMTFDEPANRICWTPTILSRYRIAMFHRSAVVDTPPRPMCRPLRSCFLAPSLPPFKVTLAAYLHKMKFEKQVPDRYGPAWVGFDHPDG